MQLLGAIANDAEHMPSLLYALRNVVRPPPHKEGDVWGVGYYDDDRALIIRKPGDILTSRDFYELAPEVKTRVLLSFVKDGTLATQHAPPHRFRRWLFGAVGDLSALVTLEAKIHERLPSFIRTEVGDAGPSEHAFAMFLKEQHERGLLNDALATGSQLAEAMQRTTDAMAMLAEEAGIEGPAASFAATNGRVMIVSNRGASLHHKFVEGLEALPDGPPDPAMNDFQAVVRALKRFRARLFAAHVDDPGEQWAEVADGTTLWVDRQLELTAV